MKRWTIPAVVLLMAVSPAVRAGGTLAESEIRVQVQDLIRRWPPTLGLFLDVEVEGAKVTLAGEARTLYQAWQAAGQASKVRGVAEVVSRIGVLRAGGGDRAVESAIRLRVGDIPPLAGSKLEFRSDSGRVVVSGRLESARFRETALEAAAQVEGVLAVEDRLEVPPLDDAKILARARAHFSRGALVTVAGEVRPSVASGVVTLEGRVPRLYEKIRAEQLVRAIDGVKSVDNRLEISPFRARLEAGRAP